MKHGRHICRLRKGGRADVCDRKQEEYRVLDSSQTRVTIVRRYNKTVGQCPGKRRENI